MIGSFGDTAFITSANKIYTYTGFNKTGEARYAEHALTGKKPLLEFIGPGLESVSYSVKLDTSYGIKPEEEIKKLMQLRDAGEAKPLVLGGRFLGNYVIISLSETHKVVDNRGQLRIVDLNINLREYADDRV